ncbi:hypothetical protein UO65_3653 [Actinokineospora spheciospongiae]|uniref:TY-Chap N-terminal domain-containing protein n=1 Tax=Actinokineospora spheciospongiae TaxID=909613 RepID=W7IWA9_9PSEU|nr:DUF6301 family protein [Actinokineospora spheciospongiae]EWC61082.1 hypothetical protein UO65_3653 [Actinokineospora spheciospongiae]
MTWKAMAPAEVCDLVDFWDAAPWPLTRDQVQQRAVERFGWTTEVEDGTSYLMNTVSGFTVPDVSTIGSKGDLSYLKLNVADTIREVTPGSRRFLGDAFALAVREGEGRWGVPTLRDGEGTTSADWDTASGGRISFNLTARSLSAVFHTPQDVEGFERADHRGSEGAKPVASDDPGSRSTTTPPVPWRMAHDWELFTERLADAFRDVTDRVFLIVHAAADPRRYVQFAAAPDLLDAEAPATDVVRDADEHLLRRTGWTAPDVAQPNWTSSLRRPALTDEFVQLARCCTAALHGAYGITSPDGLRYRAWCEPPGAGAAAAVEFPVLGLD